MDAKLQRRVQRYGWDKAAEFYEKGWKRSLAPAQQALLDLVDVKPGDGVLDLAAGTGLVSFQIAGSVGPAGRVIATDISDNMVAQLQQDIYRRGMAHMNAMRLDAEDLSVFADGSFDLVTCALGLMYFPDPETALREAKRVLKPGGSAVFAIWGRRDQCGWADIFPIVDARVQSSVCPLFFRLGNGDALEQAMSSAGFYQTNAVRVRAYLPYETEQEALDAAFSGGPVALAYSRFSNHTKQQVHAEYLASIAAFRVGKGYRIPGEFVVCAGYV